jgi:hypothetical protein
MSSAATMIDTSKIGAISDRYVAGAGFLGQAGSVQREPLGACFGLLWTQVHGGRICTHRKGKLKSGTMR